MQSKATTVKAYLDELAPDRREAISAVRKIILENVDDDIEEGMTYGMIGYYVPHRVYPKGYHCDPKMPLPYINLGSQKNHMALYMMGLYCGGEGCEPREQVTWFHEAWAKAGKKLDMGKCCIRFKKVDDLALDVLAEVIRRQPSKAYIAQIEAVFGERIQARASAKATKVAASKPGKSEAGTRAVMPRTSAKKVTPRAATKSAKKATKNSAKKTGKRR